MRYVARLAIAVCDGQGLGEIADITGILHSRRHPEGIPGSHQPRQSGEGHFRSSFDQDRGSFYRANHLNCCKSEMEIAIRTLGKTSFAEVSLEDLLP